GFLRKLRLDVLHQIAPAQGLFRRVASKSTQVSGTRRSRVFLLYPTERLEAEDSKRLVARAWIDGKSEMSEKPLCRAARCSEPLAFPVATKLELRRVMKHEDLPQRAAPCEARFDIGFQDRIARHLRVSKEPIESLARCRVADRHWESNIRLG